MGQIPRSTERISSYYYVESHDGEGGSDYSRKEEGSETIRDEKKSSLLLHVDECTDIKPFSVFSHILSLLFLYA